MSNALPPGYAIPKPQPVKTIGLLNIVFAALLLVMTVCSMTSMLMSPMWETYARAQQQQITQQITAQEEARKKVALDSLAEREKAAKSDAEKAQLAEERRAILARKPFIPDTTMGIGIMRDRSFQAYAWADYLSALPLNLMMLASGIGLIKLRPWGKRLAIWTSWLKLARIAVLLAYTVLVVSPSMTRYFGKEFDKMAVGIAQSQGGPPQRVAQIRQAMRSMTQVIGAMTTIAFAVTYLLAAIYPCVVIYVLNRPGSQAALIAAEQKESSQDPAETLA